MEEYKKMYSTLVVAMANCIENMQEAMQEAEEIYMATEAEKLVENSAPK